MARLVIHGLDEQLGRRIAGELQRVIKDKKLAEAGCVIEVLPGIVIMTDTDEQLEAPFLEVLSTEPVEADIIANHMEVRHVCWENGLDIEVGQAISRFIPKDDLKK
mgnify:CR=1 FL=1